MGEFHPSGATHCPANLTLENPINEIMMLP
jgi:hypothetical protein